MTPAQADRTGDLGGEFPPANMDAWRQLIDKALKGGDFERRLVARTADGLRIEPVFARRPDAATTTASAGGAAPHAWDIRQLHAEADPTAANAAILEALAGGASSITLQIAAASWSGLACGATEIARALDGVLLDVCPVALHAGDQTTEAAAHLITLWTARGLSAEQRRGAFNFDPLGTLAQAGGLSMPVASALASAGELLRQSLTWPHVTALRADGHVWHAAGASEAQELAAVLATVVAYLRAAETAGIDPAQALPKIVVNLAIDTDQIMGLAKLRAARRLITHVAASCGVTDAAAKVPITAETSGTMMTRRDPWVNMLRTSMACATAAWGGADCITVLPYSWALGQPDAFAYRMARNTSLVLMEESGLGKVADPAAGSFAIETLTRDLEKAAWAALQKIESADGLAAVLASGSLQNDITQTAAKKRAALATGKVLLTGTSAFPRLGDDGVTTKSWPTPMLAAVKQVRVTPLTPFRPSEPFEILRDAADAAAKRDGKPLQVYLACLGPLSSHAARATWITNFLAAGGIATLQSPPMLQSADAGRAFAASGAVVACLCGADETYTELGEATVSLLKTAGASRVYVAGRPKSEAALQAAGADRFIYAGCDIVQTLTALQDALLAAPSAG